MQNPLIKAFRLRTLPLSAGSVMLGSLLAYLDGSFNLNIAVLTLLTAFSLQILSNLANDYGDFMNGADTHGRFDRAVSSGSISPEKMKSFLIINATFTFGFGLALLLYAGSHISISFWGMLVLGIGCIAAALLYTIGKKPYGYAGFGDLAVLIFFGFVAVMGSAYLQIGEIRIEWAIPATAFGLLSVAVLNINNIRDIETDLAAGKQSVAARLGYKKAMWYQLILIMIAIALVMIFVFQYPVWDRHLVVLIVFFFYFKQLKTLFTLQQNERLAFNKLLKQLSLSNLLLVILLIVALV
jgi:1,4-dihydroxy-2-naphthoate octaprenyltransferase